MSDQSVRQGQKLTDFIRVYDDALEKDFCDGLIARFEADNENRSEVDVKGIRRFSVLNVSTSPGWLDVHDAMSTRFVASIQRYIRDCAIEWVPQDIAFEQFRIKRYRTGRGDEFKPHVDISNATLSQRMLVAFWYLNDVDEGGETEFVTLETAIQPRRGRQLIFPPTFLYPHAGRPPISNVKYILGSYLLYV